MVVDEDELFYKMKGYTVIDVSDIEDHVYIISGHQLTSIHAEYICNKDLYVKIPGGYFLFKKEEHIPRSFIFDNLFEWLDFKEDAW